MHFIVTAHDGKDSEAPLRRQAVREEHLAGVKRLIKAGRHLFGAAILDDESRMIGSVLIVDYPSRDALVNEWLSSEPYVTGKVWESIDIQPCKVPGFFLDTNIVK